MNLKNILISSLLLLLPFVPKNLSAAKVETAVGMQPIGNQIMNEQELQSLKDKISNAASSPVLIKVLHIGDSHIKGGVFSQQFMQKLNAYYANKYQSNLFFNFQWFCKIGTKYSDYNELAELDAQLKSEQPDLVIISLGVNDAASGSAETNFSQKIDHLISKIKKLSPGSSILITTPSDALKYDKAKGIYAPIHDLKNVVDMLVQYSNTHSIAYWNLYQIMGGQYSINRWVEKKLAQPDRIHFTDKGYEILADWLFTAFTNSMDRN